MKEENKNTGEEQQAESLPEQIVSQEEMITPGTEEPETTNPKLQTENMEVHKHPHHVAHKKKWGEYLLEFLMLFLAVFLGFLAENIREHQVEKERAHGLVASLLNDLQHDTTQLNMLIMVREQKTLTYDSLKELLQKPPGTYDRNLFYRLIAHSESYFKFSQSSGTISQLKNAGYLRYFSDNDLIKNISNYEFWIQDYVSDESTELVWMNEKFSDFIAFNLDNSIIPAMIRDGKLPGGTGVDFYKPDGSHNLKALVEELSLTNYLMQTRQAPRIKREAEKLMDYLHQKYHAE
jgi:hypothetical protein